MDTRRGKKAVASRTPWSLSSRKAGTKAPDNTEFFDTPARPWMRWMIGCVRLAKDVGSNPHVTVCKVSAKSQWHVHGDRFADHRECDVFVGFPAQSLEIGK